MKNRCNNPRQARFKDYGGRGIYVCDRWLHGEDGLSGFECFLKDMGPKPSPDYTVERKDNDLGYFPDNCRWAHRSEQARNTRATRYVETCEGWLPLIEAIEKYGRASDDTIRMRIHRGWNPEVAIITPTGEPPYDYPVLF